MRIFVVQRECELLGCEKKIEGSLLCRRPFFSTFGTSGVYVCTPQSVYYFYERMDAFNCSALLLLQHMYEYTISHV